MKRRIKQILVVILALCTFLCVPSTVYAKDYDFNNITVTARTKTNDYVFTVTPPRWVFNNVLQTEYQEINVLSNNTFSFNDDDTVSFSFRIGEGQNRYLGFEDINVIITPLNSIYPACVFGCELQKNNSSSPSAWSYWNNGATYYQNGVDKYLEPDACYLDYDYSTSVFNGSITSPVGYDECKILIQFGKPVYGGVTSSTTFAFGVTSFELQTESYATSMFAQISDFFSNLAERLTAWFNSLFQWLQDIRDNATEGFANIGTWFENLGNNIKTWFNNLSDNISVFFTELKNNLTEWFKNVGNWFSELGNSIGEFFTNIWNNISDSINNITNSVREWWQGVIDWLNNLFKVSDGYFDEYNNRWLLWFEEHLGFLWQSQYFFDDFVNVIIPAFNSGQMDCVVRLPRVVLPFDNIVLWDAMSFDLAAYIKGNEMFNLLYEMLRAMVAAVIVCALLNYCYNKFNKVFGEG